MDKFDLVLIYSLVFGPWLTVSGILAICDQSRIREKSSPIDLPVRLIVRRVSTDPSVPDDPRLWGAMVLFVGLLLDLLALSYV